MKIWYDHELRLKDNIILMQNLNFLNLFVFVSYYFLCDFMWLRLVKLPFTVYALSKLMVIVLLQLA